MQDSIRTSVGYKGNIEVSIRSKLGSCNSPFYFHNRGTKAFFDTLCRALCGQNVSAELPSHLDIYVYDSSGIHIGSKLVHKLPFIGTVWGEAAGANSANGKVLFKTLITLSDIGSLAFSKSNTAKLVLLSRSGTPLCEVDTDLSWLDEITESSDGLVVWTLTFSNDT